jgi:tartrate-resistant acid phosphatase type 5
LAILIWAASAAADERDSSWIQEADNWRDPEGVLWSNASVLGLRKALEDRVASEAAATRDTGFDAATKLPAYVDENETLDGEGYFAVVGDWGNPWDPGSGRNDGFGQYWGPHWKCSIGWVSGDRCKRGTPDFMRDDMSQLHVSEQMTKFAQKNRLQFIVNVGDSLYPASFSSPTDPLWNKVFESRYPDKSLQIPWLSVLGNHDWGGFDCYMDGSGRLYRADSQINYDTEHDWAWPANKKSRWVLPHPVYNKRINFGNTTIDLFAIDTNWVKIEEPCGLQPSSRLHCDTNKCRAFLNNLGGESWQSLERGLAQSDATWKFVFGHHPISFLGNWHGREKNIIGLLARLNASAYLTGHEHSNHLRWYTQKPGGQAGFDNGDQRPGAVMEIQSGGAGGAISDNPGYRGLNPYGFVAVKVTPNELEVTYVSDQGKYMEPFVVPPPCAQLHNSTCAWTTKPWSNCVEGKRQRLVKCSRGHSAYCANNEKPAAEESCSGPPGPSPDGGRGHVGLVIAIVAFVCVAAAAAAALFYWHRRRTSSRRPPLLEVGAM